MTVHQLSLFVTSVSPDRDRQSQPPTVLLAEDEPDVREIYKLYLVQTAANGAIALGLMTDEIDLVLSDRRMPEMSGDELYTRIQEEAIEVPFVMISAVDSEESLPDGLDDYLTKPITRSDLTACINRHISSPVIAGD
jgi:CheY-like chemotaxis protein